MWSPGEQNDKVEEVRMQLYLIRHGESFVNRGDWENLPSMDAGLTEKGHQQAIALRDWLRDHRPQADILYCSTMRRAQETATYVSEALGLAPIGDDRLREIGNNYASGQPIEEANLPRTFDERWWDKMPFAPRALEPENSESWMHFRLRLAQFVEQVAENHPGQCVYVVAHHGVIGAIFDNLFNVGPYRRCAIQIKNTGWTLFEHHPETGREPWSLKYHNRIDHLIGTDLL